MVDSADGTQGAATLAVDTASDQPVDLHEVYGREFLPLTRLAAMVVGDGTTAQDVVQDVFASLHGRWQRISHWPEARLLGYTRRAVLNGARSVLRHRTVAATTAPDPHGTAAAAEDAALSRLGERDLRAAVAGLPRRQREVVLLRYLLDLSAAETARTLGISVSAVTSSAARGVATLQTVLRAGED